MSIIIEEKKSLKELNTFRVGGVADYFCMVKNEAEVIEALNFARDKNTPFFILGGGSNILISDDGFRGLAIKINLSGVSFENERVVVGAGISLAQLLKESMEHGLVGLEWAVGIPGTVGGAVCGNCGAYGGEMADSVVTVSVLRDNKIIKISKEDCGFDYRQSIFKKSGEIIISVELKLEKGDIEKAKNKVKEIREQRKNKIPTGFNAGSIFKNNKVSEKEILWIKSQFGDLPEKFIQDKIIPAGWLIDKCGLKGKVVGDAEISQIHAGIIVNNGKATALDIFELIKITKLGVKNNFGIDLEEEIKFIGFNN